jgi:hypothetical protein
MDFRDELETDIFLYGEDKALENITNDMIKQDNIECCVCLNFHWGVKLPNCSHFICPKCYYRIYNGYISCDFHSENLNPEEPKEPIYPYQNRDINKEIFKSITNNNIYLNNIYLEWFIDDNEDLYNSVKMNSEFVDKLDVKLKLWFENNELLKQYENDILQYKNLLEQYNIDIETYNEKYEAEKDDNAQKICPLCRL